MLQDDPGLGSRHLEPRARHFLRQWLVADVDLQRLADGGGCRQRVTDIQESRWPELHTDPHPD